MGGDPWEAAAESDTQQVSDTCFHDTLCDPPPLGAHVLITPGTLTGRSCPSLCMPSISPSPGLCPDHSLFWVSLDVHILPSPRLGFPGKHPWHSWMEFFSPSSEPISQHSGQSFHIYYLRYLQLCDLFTLAEPQFLHQNGDNKSICSLDEVTNARTVADRTQ